MAEDANPANDQALVEQWIQAVEAAEEDEKEWREEADKAEDAYRGEKDSKDNEFNLFHSNIETLLPAIYNSQPAPDIRRRWGDGGEVGKTVADILERGISFSIDQYDFDGNLGLAIADMAIPGRGTMRVRYVPSFGPTAAGVEGLTYESAQCEYVPWMRFTRGKAITWSTMPWIKFDQMLDKDEVQKLIEARAQMMPDAHPIDISKIPFTHDPDDDEDDKRKTSNSPSPFKTAKFWEIWDKRTREVLFICPEYCEQIILRIPDPLKLKDFWPIPRPMQAIRTVGELTPVCPLTIYRTLLDELNIVTRRISRLVRQLRPRGWYAAQIGQDIKLALEGDDGELAPLQGAEAQSLLSSPGGMDKAIAWFPLEPTIEALRVLVEQREQIKQTIYEVTGIADIIRGATKANETARAQEIKAQWGSLRIQSMQAEVARFVRDLFRIKVEIISRFQPETLMTMTDIKLLPQQQKDMLMQAAQANPQQAQQVAQQKPELLEAMKRPSLEEVMGVLKSDQMRAYRIDVETDSTIRADFARFQQQSALFLQGTAQFAQAIGPLVQEGGMPPDIAIEIYTSFARQFKLGKSAEDALERWSQSAKDGQGGPQQPQQDPKLQTAQIGLQTEQTKGQNEQAKLQGQQQLEQTKTEGKLSVEESKRQTTMLQAQVAPHVPMVQPGGVM